MLVVESLEFPGGADLGDDEWRSFRHFGQAAELLYRELNAALTVRYGLSVPDVHLLKVLNTDPRRHVRMGTLAAELVLSPSRVTWQVGRLEDRGLVRRFRSSEDKRWVVVGITRKGRECLRPVLRTYSAWVRRHYLAPLTRDQVTALGQSTGRVGEALKPQTVSGTVRSGEAAV